MQTWIDKMIFDNGKKNRKMNKTIIEKYFPRKYVDS